MPSMSPRILSALWDYGTRDEGLETVHESQAATIELTGSDANSGVGL